MSVSLAPPVRFKAFYPGTGNPLAGGKLWSLQPGTSGFGYLKATYTDSTGQTVNANPVILDACGEADVWLSGYTKLVLQDSAGSLVWSKDNVSSSAAAGTGQGQWVNQALLATYISGTQFKTPGDETALFPVGLRIQAIVSAGTLYGTVTTTSIAGNPLYTTVTVAWDSGALDAGLSAVATGIITPVATALPAPPIYVSNYASLTAAVAALGSAPMDLLINVPATVTGATTVPGNISIVMAEGGKIVGAGGTLTINGPFRAEGQAFSGFLPGQVTGLREARPEYWTTNSVPGTTDMTNAVACAFAANASGNVVFGGGDYLINNSAGALTVTGFSGTIRFTSCSRLVMSDNTKGGIAFSGGSGAVIQDIHIAYNTPTTTNTGGHALELISTTDTRLIRPYVEDSACGAVVIWCCTRPYVENGFSVTSQRDALHFDNCSDPRVNGWESLASGDDGVSFVNNAGLPDASGGLATNIIVRNSKASGIKSAGHSNLVISDFYIEGTSSSGVIVYSDGGTLYRVPSNVSISDGIVRGAGTVTPRVGNQFGVEFSACGTGIAFRNIDVFSPYDRGVCGTAAAGEVSFDNVKVVSSGNDSAFNLTCQTLTLGNLTAITPAGMGFYVGNCGAVIAKGLKVVNASGIILHRAAWFADNAAIGVDGLEVIDTANPAVAYIVGYSGATAGYMTNINGYVPHGTFEPPANPGSLKIGTTVVSP